MRFSRAILLSETVFNSDNSFLHVLKAIVSQKTRAFFKDLVTKGNRSSYVQVTIYHCEKPICMRCTVTQLARESVGLCPLSSFVREGIRVITQLTSKQSYKNNSCTQFAREDVGLSLFYNSYVKKKAK